MTSRRQISSRNTSTYNLIIEISDYLISIFIITPLVIGTWRGLFAVQNMFLIPEKPIVSALISFLLGLTGEISFILLQYQLNSILKRRHTVTFVVLSRGLNIVLGIYCIAFWRGLWNLLDIFTGDTWESSISQCTIGITCLILLKSLRNIICPPFAVELDNNSQNFFTIGTLYGTDRHSPVIFRLADTFFTVVIVSSLTIVVWRSSWYLIDLYLQPDDLVSSAWISFIFAVSWSLILMTSQPLFLPYYEDLLQDGWGKILLGDLYHLLTFLGVINAWRGTWMLLDIYLLPNHLVLSNLVNIIAGFVLLTAGLCFRTVLEIGADMDFLQPGSQGLKYQTGYLSKLFHNKQNLLI